MKSRPKLSDIQTIDQIQTPPIERIQTTRDIEFAKTEHTIEMAKRKKDINEKVSDLNRKLKKHELKEGMLDKIIGTTYAELENLNANEFTRRGQKHSILIKQMEALSILHDTLIKYEDMIQKYHKILIDIENSKIGNHIRIESLKKEEKVADENISEILNLIQEQLIASSGNNGLNPLLDEIKEELEKDDY